MKLKIPKRKLTSILKLILAIYICFSLYSFFHNTRAGQLLSEAVQSFVTHSLAPATWTTNGIVITLFLGIIPFLTLLAAIYRLLQKLKGKIVFHLGEQIYQPGEVIEGELSVVINRSIDVSQVVLEIIAFNEGREREVRKGKYTTTSTKHIHFQKTLSFAKNGLFTAGQPQSFKFQFELPLTIRKKPKLSPTIVIGGNPDVKWTLIARVEMPGIDLYETKELDVAVPVEDAADTA